MVKNKEEYELLLKSGMFWEFHPELTGDWEKDKFEILTTDNLKESYLKIKDAQNKLREDFNNLVKQEESILEDYVKSLDYSEKEEDYIISKRLKKVEKRIYGRVKFMQTFKDDDTGESIEAEMSVVVNNNGKWIHPQIRSIVYDGFPK